MEAQYIMIYLKGIVFFHFLEESDLKKDNLLEKLVLCIIVDQDDQLKMASN